MAELTVEQATRIVEQAEQRRLKKNAAVKAWREENKERYSAYMKQWHADRKALLDEAKAVLKG